jgi:hypothetical protein
MELEHHELYWVRLQKGRILAYYVGETRNGHAFVTGLDGEAMSGVPENRLEKIPAAYKRAATVLLEQQIEREDMLDEVLFQNAQCRSRVFAERPALRRPAALSAVLASTWNCCKLWLTTLPKLSTK